MIPVGGHRYLPSGRGIWGHPVPSMYQADIIAYGVDLLDYIEWDFGPDRSGFSPDVAATVPFCTDVVDANNDPQATYPLQLSRDESGEARGVERACLPCLYCGSLRGGRILAGAQGECTTPRFIRNIFVTVFTVCALRHRIVEGGAPAAPTGDSTATHRGSRGLPPANSPQRSCGHRAVREP
jgi:hypothetical protein